jgi:hypothetical protein
MFVVLVEFRSRRALTASQKSRCHDAPVSYIIIVSQLRVLLYRSGAYFVREANVARLSIASPSIDTRSMVIVEREGIQQNTTKTPVIVQHLPSRSQQQLYQ